MLGLAKHACYTPSVLRAPLLHHALRARGRQAGALVELLSKRAVEMSKYKQDGLAGSEAWQGDAYGNTLLVSTHYSLAIGLLVSLLVAGVAQVGVERG